MKPRVRVLVVDDQTLFRQALAQLLSSDPRLSVAGEAEDGEDAVHKVDALMPDVVLMDVVMPRLDGIRATARIKARHPAVRVVILASDEKDETVIEAMKVGAQGYLQKDVDRDSLVEAVLQAVDGRHVLSAAAQRTVVAAALGQAEVQEPPDGLTRRQFDILRLMSIGLAFKQIGRTLGLSEKTVRNQASLLYSKLRVHDRAEAILYALHKGFGA